MRFQPTRAVEAHAAEVLRDPSSAKADVEAATEYIAHGYTPAEDMSEAELEAAIAAAETEIRVLKGTGGVCPTCRRPDEGPDSQPLPPVDIDAPTPRGGPRRGPLTLSCQQIFRDLQIRGVIRSKKSRAPDPSCVKSLTRYPGSLHIILTHRDRFDDPQSGWHDLCMFGIDARWVTVSTVAELLECSDETVRKLDHLLAPYRLNGGAGPRVYDMRVVEAFVLARARGDV